MAIFLWSEAMLVADCLKSNNQYPKIIKFCEGYYGGSESLTIEKSDTVVVASVFSQKRVMGFNSEQTVLSLPVQSPLKFYKDKGTGHSQTLSAIVNEESFPFTIDVDINCLSKEDIYLKKYLTRLTVMFMKNESYFCGYNLIRGELSEQELIMPLYLDIKTEVANGFCGATHEGWETFIAMVKNELLKKQFFKIEECYNFWIYSDGANVQTGMPDRIFPLLQDKEKKFYIDFLNINTPTASASPVIHLKSILAEKDLEVGSQDVKENNTKPKLIDIKMRAPIPLPRKTQSKSTIGIVEDSSRNLSIYSDKANIYTRISDHIVPLLQDKGENIYNDIQNIKTLAASASPVIHLKSILGEKDLEVGSQHVKENNTKPKPIDIKLRTPMPLPRKTPPKSTIGIVEDSPPTLPPRTYRLSNTRELPKRSVSLPHYFLKPPSEPDILPEQSEIHFS